VIVPGSPSKSLHEERLAAVGGIVEQLGHQVVARETTIDTVARVTRDELPDAALVGLGADPEQALAMISRIVKEAACPVVALLEFADPEYVNEAAKRGVFAYVVANGDPVELQNALDITLRRFAEYHNLEGAFTRRATIEQAKGILMERHGITSEQAFELLRRESTDTGRKLIDLARAVTDSHRLLPDRKAPKPSTF
jgi:AmiR/NasT family two-component response regulator